MAAAATTSITATTTTRRKSRVFGVVFGLWAAIVLTGGSSLMASHLAALPTPQPIDPHVVAEVRRAGALENDAMSWTAVHVLAERCGCSNNVMQHLVRRGAVEGVRERILWVSTEGGAPPPASMATRGFTVEVISPAMLAERLGVIGAPTLIVGGPDGVVKYVGGYSRQKQSPVVVDVDVHARLRRGETVEPLPVLGCAIDKKTARRMDPLGLR
jgi:hypothetical protein